MKKVFVLLAIVSFATSGMAANEMDYAIFNGKAYFCEHAKVLFNKIRLHWEDGTDLIIPLKEVDTYCVDGRIFNRLPLLCKKGEVKQSVFLELVAQRNGLRLYRYCSMDDSLGTCFMDNTGRTGIYVVYNKDNELHLCVDKENMQTVLPFFHLNII
jgi:hypothetical protein